MRTLYVMLTASLFLAGFPIASADHQNCFYHTPQEGMAHPMTKERYILLDAQRPDKLGEWTNTNGRAGLQSEDCLLGGIPMYRADKREAVLP